jgi:hypothetical protein
MMKLTYRDYWFFLDRRHVTVRAISHEAALADIHQAFGEDVRIITWGMC